MRKRVRSVLLLLGILLVAVFVLAEPLGTTVVTVVVEDAIVAAVPPAVSMNLRVGAAGDENYIGDQVHNVNGLKLTHTKGASQKITATAVKTGGGNNDITLCFFLDALIDGNKKILVEDGTDLVNVLIWTGIAAGSYTKDIYWCAQATTAGTVAGTYVWDVTFTLTDQ